MSPIIIRNFIASDIPAVTALQEAYREAYPHAVVVPWEHYLSAGFETGRNIFCAFDESGNLLGYAPFFPTFTDKTDLPHTLWAEVKALPSIPDIREVKEALFERVLKRAGEAAAGHAARLTFQYHPSETASIGFVEAHGCAYSESVYRLWRDLAAPVAPLPDPAGMRICPWSMEGEAEQQAYIQARNEAFLEAPTALADWQNFMSSPEWKQGGTSITAFEGEKVAGSVAVYWDEALSAQLGTKVGFTEYIFVREKWRGRGVAAAMITQGLRYLQEHGREAALLEVKAANENALNLYLKLGYRIVDETRLYIKKLGIGS